MTTMVRRAWVPLFALALLVSPSAHADVTINILGFRYESKNSRAPSLQLDIREVDTVVSGRWSAELGQSRPSKYEQIWFPVSIKDGGSQNSFGAHADSEKFLFLFADKKPWAGQEEILTPAGSLMFTGKASGKTAQGDFTFRPDANYLAQASAHLKAPPSVIELLELGFAGVRIDQIMAFAKSGLQLSASEVIRLKSSGVTPQYLETVRKAQPFSLDEIIRLRNSGVPESFPSAMQSAGYDFDAQQLIRLRNSGISAEHATEWKNAGFNFDHDGLVKMRNSGIRPDFAKAVKEVFPHIGNDELVRVRNSGVPKEFLVEVKKAEPDFSVEEIIRLRNSGVSADYVRAWQSAGFQLRPEELIRLRNYGVPVDYAAAINIPNRKPVSVDTLIKLRNRGLTAQEIRELRE